nr:hypothetical protein [Candidatus Sigynarchaeum springense]MDO8119158.1 hypothetical protein [Candidatus Sigynarchaeota archaeon]
MNRISIPVAIKQGGRAPVIARLLVLTIRQALDWKDMALMSTFSRA